MEKLTVTLVGIGNAGCAFAGDLKLKGHTVKLLKTTAQAHMDTFKMLLETQGISVIKKDQEYFVKTDLITTDYGSALQDTDIIIIATRTVAHEELAPKICPYIRDGQVVLFEPGNGGSLIFANHTKDRMPVYAEATNIPLDSRIVAPGKVAIRYEKARNPIGFFPAKEMDYGLGMLRNLYSTFIPLKHVLEAAMHNPNLIIHPVGAVMSVVRIESGTDKFWMYKEAFTPSVWNIVEKLDSEKMRILEKMDLEPLSYLEIARYRNVEDLTIDPKQIFDSWRFSASPEGPYDTSTRYITEDVPICLGLMHSLGRKVGAKTEICDALITLASALNRTDYWSQARTLKTLGVEDLTLPELNSYLQTGKKRSSKRD